MKKLSSFFLKPSLSRTLLFLVATIGFEYLKRWSDKKTLEREGQSSTNLSGRPEQSEQKEKKFAQGTRDYVDESSWESFPASDASAKY